MGIAQVNAPDPDQKSRGASKHKPIQYVQKLLQSFLQKLNEKPGELVHQCIWFGYGHRHLCVWFWLYPMDAAYRSIP
jgi:hypothetical protein